MTPDELWNKYCTGMWTGNHTENAISKSDFLAALAEYGEAVRADAVNVCNTVESVKWNMHLSGKPTTLKCSDAIKDMKLP